MATKENPHSDSTKQREESRWASPEGSPFEGFSVPIFEHKPAPEDEPHEEDEPAPDDGSAEEDEPDPKGEPPEADPPEDEPPEDEPPEEDDEPAPDDEPPEDDERAPEDESPDDDEPPSEDVKRAPVKVLSPSAKAWPPPKTPEPLSREKPKVVLMTEKVVNTVLRDPDRTASAVFAVIGAAVCMTWALEMLLLWFPLDLQNMAWIFGTAVGTVDMLPSAAVGGALLTFGLLKHPHAPPRVVRTLSTVFAAFAGLFGFITVSFVPSIASAFAQAPEVTVPALRRTVFLTVAELVLAVVACAGVARLLWRAVKRSERTGGKVERRAGA